jgi:hypothetical protein
LGRRFSFGIWTSSIKIIPVVLALNESLPFMGGHSRPFIPLDQLGRELGNTFSKMNPRILLSHLHFAQTTQISAMGELVIHVFDPESE